MIIQINTDKTISGNERKEEYFSSLIQDGMSRFTDHLTRIEAHLSDENGPKKGEHDKRCMLEARIKNLKPIAVTSQGDTLEQAVSEAIDKLTSTIETQLRLD